jgi:SAM-dependent methyltransferase
MLFPVSDIEVNPFIPFILAFIVSFFTSMGGVSGAFLLLPFQVSFLGYTAPSVSGTNQVFNIISDSPVCGTGRFASRPLVTHLSPSVSYLGIDLSKTMIAIAAQRVLPCKEQAKVTQSDGFMHFPLPDHSVDRVVFTCVLDLLTKPGTRRQSASLVAD